MAYLNVANFKFGLDTRRSQLTSVPGTLEMCENAHINQGGEVEKRKAFVGVNCVVGSVVAGTLPKGTGYCFGAEPGVSTIYTFGSANTPGGLPAEFTYLKCVSPQGGNMIGVTYSTTFAGLPFIIAVFDDTPFGASNTYCFYNGVIVGDLVSGLISAGAAAGPNSVIADLFVGQNFPTGNYTSIYNLFTATANVLNTPGTQFIPTINISSAAGTLVANEVSANTPSVAAGSAVGSFSVTGGSAAAGNLISSVKVNAVEVLGANVLWVTDNAHTAVAVAAQIVTWCLAHALAYTAIANGQQVNIYTVGGTPGASNGFVVQATSAGNVCVGDCIMGFSLNGAAPGNLCTDFFIGSYTAGVIAWNTDLVTSVAALATHINSTANASGYCAFANGASLRLSKTVTASNDAAIAISPVLGANVAVSVGSSTNLAALVQPSVAAITKQKVGYGSSYVNVLASGGVPPYSYKWTITAKSALVDFYGNPIPYTIGVSPNVNAPSVFFTFPANQGLLNGSLNITANAVCQVTDSQGSIVSSNVVDILLVS